MGGRQKGENQEKVRDMAQSIGESLYNAIIKDDLKAFGALAERAQCGAYRLGRFPVLSLLYLYKSRRIISAYGERFIKISSWEPLREPPAVSRKFAQKAGKCLRLYLNEVVSPLEMLLILNKTRRLKRVYPLTKPSAAVKERLQSIYSIRYSLNIKFEGDDIILDRRPLSYGEKKKLATVCMCSALAVAVAVGTPLTAVALIPKRAEGEVTKLSHIDFGSRNEYTLKKDISLPENFSVEKVNCKINGGGNRLIFGKGATLGALNGKISNVTIVTSGDTVFTTVAENAVVQDITVSVSTETETSSNTAFLAGTNYGTIDGVTLNVSGKLTAFAGEGAERAEITVGGIVLNNAYKSSRSYGKITNCTVNYSDFSLVGEVQVDAMFGGVAGVNYGELLDSTVTGAINADTFDLAGVCTVNGGILSGNINEAKLSQVSDSDSWSPNACGIVYENSYAVEYCENRGEVSAVSTYALSGENAPMVFASGISCMNYGQIAACKNSGAITAEGSGRAFVGGIAARSTSIIYNCVSGGDITVRADDICAGGILGFSLYSYGSTGSVESCISENKLSVTATGDKPCLVGGIVGLLQEVNNNVYYFCGLINNCYFIGEWVNGGSYSGNIVGVCGANVYESNSYTSGNTEYTIFKDNYYSVNSYTAFGAAVVTDGENNEEFFAVADKGATAAGTEDIKNSEAYKNILNELLKF